MARDTYPRIVMEFDPNTYDVSWNEELNLITSSSASSAVSSHFSSSTSEESFATNVERLREDHAETRAFDWSAVPDNGRIIRLKAEDLVYPNYPHAYSWRPDEFNENHLRDYLDVMTTINDGSSDENGIEDMDTRTILAVLRLTLKRTNFTTNEICSELLSRTFAIFFALSIYRLRFYAIKMQVYPPDGFCDESWKNFFDRVELRDFVNDVAVTIAVRESLERKKRDEDAVGNRETWKKCKLVPKILNYKKFARDQTKLLYSKAFFTFSMKMLIINFYEITYALREKVTSIFETFVSNGNIVMALPYSFFVSNVVVSRLDYRLPGHSFAPILQKRIERFIKNLRIYDYRCFNDTTTFDETVPNWRYVNLKLFTFLDIYRFMGDFKFYKNAHIDAFIVMKTLGSIPIGAIPTLGREFEVRDLRNLLREDCPLARTWRADAEEFFGININNQAYYYELSEEVESLARRRVTPDNRCISKRGVCECAVCLIGETTIIFLPCFHQATCIECSLRLVNCPICREPIIRRISRDSNIFDELQLMVLYESLSMFEKYFNELSPVPDYVL